MTAEAVQRVEENYRLIVDDDAARRASLLLARGITLSDMGTDSALQAASLLAFYQVLETVSSAVSSKPPAGQEENGRRYSGRCTRASILEEV